MGYLINCAACGKPHPLDPGWCKARNPQYPKGDSVRAGGGRPHRALGDRAPQRDAPEARMSVALAVVVGFAVGTIFGAALIVNAVVSRR